MAAPTRTVDAPDVLHPTASLADAGTGTAALPGSAGSSAPPAPADRYVLGEEIARGGMGEVYRATDTVLAREVAIKVLQAKYAPTSGTARRFADEARITGQLQHPAIPPVHDLGTLSDGRPFLAMKLIKGQTLDDQLKARPDPSVERGRFVAVFEAICQGVAYAHAHGVIHRDLKPQNVMVGAFGEVQVMDWGLAKILAPLSPGGRGVGGEGESDETVPPTEIKSMRDSEDSLTQAGSVLGTPAYMPPEQAIGAVDQIDRRSDVFGLGGILAAILTGKPPFQGPSGESTRQLAAKGKVQDCFARLDASGADPELVALCKRCLAPERDDRPADAAAVAKAVAALRTAADERARQAELDKVRMEGEKLTADLKVAEGRKRRQVWLGLAGVLALGMAMAVVLAIVADRSRRAAETAEWDADNRRIEAEAAKEKAEGETQLANGVKNFLQRDVLQLADPATQQQDKNLDYNADIKLRDVVLRASKAIDGKFADRPLVEAELRGTLGYTLLGMGRADLAVGHYERTRAIYADHFGPDHPDTLASMHRLANSYAALDRRPEALKLREEVLARRKKVLGADHPDTLRSMNNLAHSFSSDLGRLQECLKLREEVFALQKAKFGPDHPDTLLGMHNLAAIYLLIGRPQEAITLHEEAFALQKANLGPDHPETLAGRHVLADSYFDIGHYPEALKLREETLAQQKAKLGPDHPSTLASMRVLADSYAAAGRRPEALKLREEVLVRQKKVLGPDHPDTLRSMDNLADSYSTLGRRQEAMKLRAEVLARQKAKPDQDNMSAMQSNARLFLQAFADSRAQAFKLQLECNEEVVALQKAKLGADHPDTLRSMNNLALTYDAVGRHPEALNLREETLARRKKVLGPDHPDTLRTLSDLTRNYDYLGRQPEALKLREELFALQKVKFGPDHIETLSSLSDLARSYANLGRHPEALKLHEEAFALNKTKFGPDNVNTLHAAEGVIASLIALKRPDEALPRIDEALKLADQATAARKTHDLNLRPRLIHFRFRIFAERKDVKKCMKSTEIYEKLALATPNALSTQLGRPTWNALYNAACHRGVLAGLLKDTPAEAKSEADKSMDWLRKAVAAGVREREHMETNADLDSLRDRDDFKTLVGSLRYLAPPPRLVK